MSIRANANQAVSGTTAMTFGITHAFTVYLPFSTSPSYGRRFGLGGVVAPDGCDGITVRMRRVDVPERRRVARARPSIRHQEALTRSAPRGATRTLKAR